MVDAVVSFVIDRLGDLLIEQVVFLRGVKDDVEWLRSRLQYMLCFLKDAEEKQDVDHRTRQWITDIRDVAYEAEDIIDNFILKVEAGTPKKMGLKDCFEKYFCICSKRGSLIQQANLYGIGQEINTLKTKLTHIEQSRESLGIKSTDDARERSDRMNARENWLRKERPYKDNEHVVGFKEDTEKLTSELIKEVKDRYMISIVGIGGLGKTTIARKLYNNLSREQKFDDYAWLSVSACYEIQDLLRSTIKSFKRPTTKEELEFLEKMKEEDLEPYLRNYLKGRRYLVVLDDVWDINAWPSLMGAFPDENNGSRVIMTTRNKVVAKASNERTYVHELPFLKDKESWELFCNKAFPNYNNEVGDRENRCPACLESLAREMASKCRGLPLAIVVLGCLLRRKDPDEWPKFKEHMWRHIRDDDSIHVQHILALSFNDLPYHLKSCFLYLGLFPEDFEIYAEKLYRLWEAEGFTKLGKESFEEEEEAEACLRALIDRSLIQVVQRNWKRIITCRVHDLLRDLAIEKSKELNFLQIYGGRLATNCRRLAFNGGLERFISLDISDMHLRTLLFFNLENEDTKIAHLQSLCRKLRLLRVLDLKHHGPFGLFGTIGYEAKEKQILHDEIGKMIHLRYLGLCGTNINPLSQLIGNLHALQTLELGTQELGSSVDPIQLPNEIGEAKQLRHLIGCFKWPFRVDNMKNLQTLKRVSVEDQMEFNPMDLNNLRELHVEYVRKDEKSCTLDSIGGLRSLQSLELRVSVEDGNRIPEVHLHPLSHCQSLLQLGLFYGREINFSANWKFPTDWKHPNLKSISLDASGVTEDPMQMLEKLPKLTVLRLGDYHAKKLVCTAGGFPQLEIFYLSYIDVNEFQGEEGGMPVLKGFSLEDCGDITLPDRLRSIPALEPPLYWYEWAY